MADNESLGVTISAREIYDQIVGLRDDVKSLVQSNNTTAEKIADHEERLRSVEKWKFAVPATLVVALTSAGTTLIKTLGGS